MERIGCCSDICAHFCTQPTGWVRIGTSFHRLPANFGFRLHSAYGLGEDWNSFTRTFKTVQRNGCTQPTGWVRIGTRKGRYRSRSTRLLHSAYGLGEDWNTPITVDGVCYTELHSAYGLGEDWNPPLAASHKAAWVTLHSAYGLGEDWNTSIGGMPYPFKCCTQPTGWVRIGTTCYPNALQSTNSCTQPTGWVRIGTQECCFFGVNLWQVALSLRAG